MRPVPERPPPWEKQPKDLAPLQPRWFTSHTQHFVARCPSATYFTLVSHGSLIFNGVIIARGGCSVLQLLITGALLLFLITALQAGRARRHSWFANEETAQHGQGDSPGVTAACGKEQAGTQILPRSLQCYFPYSTPKGRQGRDLQLAWFLVNSLNVAESHAHQLFPPLKPLHKA